MIKNKLKIGLALGSGAARGLAHIGVLRVLEDEEIPIDYIAGTSAGALIGSLYAGGLSSAEICDIAEHLTLGEMLDIKPPKSGLIAGNKFREFMRNSLGDVRIEDMKIPYACIATDIITGEEVVLKEGSVIEAVRASISIPGLFQLVRWPNGQYLVDGAVVNPMPVQVLRDMGADKVIAVNALPIKKEGRKNNDEAPGIFEIMLNTVEISATHMLQHSLSQADCVISVDTRGFKPFDFKLTSELMQKGITAAKDALPEIKNILNL